MKDFVRPHPDKIIINTYREADIRFLESVMSLSNGYMGMRGSFEEGCEAGGLPGTYIAGVWYPDRTKVGWWKNGYPEYFGKAVNVANIIDVDIYINGVRVKISEENLRSFYMELDMQRSVLLRKAVLATPFGNITIEALRFLSFDMKNVCAIRYGVTAQNELQLKLVPHIDFGVYNESSNYNEKLMISCGQDFYDGIGYIEAVTKENEFGKLRYGIWAAMSVAVASGKAQIKEILHEGYASLEMLFRLGAGETARIDKIVSLATTRDNEEFEQSALESVRQASMLGFDELLMRHADKFADRMKPCDIVIKGDDRAQQGVRYCMYQLSCAFDGSDPRLNIGPKGMTGEKYGGAAYWDTDAFLIPFYLGTHDASVAKNLLKFRYNTLEQAKENAAKLGLKGALYPMVTFDGEECHNEWEITFEEIHRNGAVAYAIYNYVTYTGDIDYLKKFGFPVLLEICRFWADRVHWCARKGLYMIHGVTGPNEYENNVNNNWYTNRIAKWCLEYTLSVARDYAGKLSAKITEDELAAFKRISDNMYLPYDEERGIFVQQDGYLEKELLPADTLAPEERPLWQHWSWDRVLRSCFIKQADVLQGLYFLGGLYDRETVRRNFEFYEPYTVHESSLSAGIHSVVAARTGLYDKAYELFLRAARLDVDDLGDDTSDGLHITAMSGAWLAVVQGFAGMKTTGNRLEFEPQLPDGLKGYSFTISYRGTSVLIEVSQGGVKAKKLSGASLNIYLYCEQYKLEDSCGCALKKY